MDEDWQEERKQLYKALEITLRVAVTALADGEALAIQMRGADLLEPEFERLRHDLREGLLDKLRAIFQQGGEDLLQRLQDFEGTIQ